MQNNPRHKHIINFLRCSLRRPLAVLLIVSTIFTASAPFVSDASAQRSIPVPGEMIMRWGSLAPNFGRIDEVVDFKPHYGTPFFYISLPTPIPEFARAVWCSPPIIVFGVCVSKILPKNWCGTPAQCMLTNIVNLEASLYIKHAWPSGGGRLRDAVNKIEIKPDYYSRDLCVKGAKLGYDRFDPNTGELITPSVQVAGVDTATPADSSRYDERATGSVIGSRPSFGTCMPRINTPKVSLSSTGNTAFSYYMNAGNDPFRSVGDDNMAPNTIYGTSNRYLSTNFFLGGSLGCPDTISGLPPSGIAADAAAWKEAASRCYDYFIFQRATHPEWTLERPGSATDDPLTLDANRGGHPDLSIFNNCQPLMDGNDSTSVINGASPVAKGFAAVLQYQRPDLDEAEYDTSLQLRKTFMRRFPGSPFPAFQNIFPCVQNLGDAGPMLRTNWGAFNRTLIINYAISFAVEMWPLNKTWGPQYFIPISDNDEYRSPGGSKAGFCPNIEKINDPTHPFAPRDDFRSVPNNLTAQMARYAELKLQANRDQFSFGSPRTEIYVTDREYSFQTNVFTPRDRIFHDWEQSYSSFDPINPLTAFESLKHPEVMCAIVPVDIMEPRRRAFDNCIMQRINFNFTTWRRRNFLSFYYSTQRRGGGSPISGAMVVGAGIALGPAGLIVAGVASVLTRDGTLLPWVKPCVTRFYESDTYEQCPVTMSIQQCCRILVKDVVPINYVKIRTCEGLRQKRNMIFGFDHIYDYSTKTLVTFKDDYAIRVASTGTDEEKAAAAAIIYTKELDTPVPITSQNGRSVVTPTSQAAYDEVYLLNQKLALIGCDNTEPNEYRLSNYFGMSRWPELPSEYTTPINDALNAAQRESDDLIQAAREAANTAVTAAIGDIPTAWDIFNDAKNLLDDGVNAAQRIADTALAAERVADTRLKNALSKASVFLPTTFGVAIPNLPPTDTTSAAINAALIALGPIPTEVPAAIGQEILDATQDLVLKRGTAAGLFLTLEGTDTVPGLKRARDSSVKLAEDALRNGIAAYIEAKERYVILNGKTLADRTLTNAISTIRNGISASANTAADAVMSALNSNPVTQLALAYAGEGGAHMPYMRWWDTGKSAGNPLHGGSFINTLGSYDTIIGAGHEERNFGDATDDVTTIDTIQDQSLVEAAVLRLERARAEVAAAQYAYDTAPRTFRCCRRCSWGRTCCRDCATDLTPYINRLNAARAELNAAIANLEWARRQSVTTITTSSSPARIDPQESLTQPSRMSRIGGWEGLKGHQMLTTRRNNLSCIGRYEKLFKQYGQESYVLAKAGANYTSKTKVQWPWPLGWRGYINDPNNDFEKNIIGIGLDNVQKGDLIIYTISGVKRISYVEEVNRTDPQFVKISSWDQGKFPTASGSSLTMGQRMDRTIYRTIAAADILRSRTVNPTTGAVTITDSPIATMTQVAKIGDQPSCEDPSFTSCVLGGAMEVLSDTGTVLATIPNSTWDDVKIYRPSTDTAQRQCPMINMNRGSGRVNLQTSELSTNSFSFCVNAGFDPPPEYVIGYHGAGAGNVSDTTLCGPTWGSCSVYGRTDSILCFPGRQVCGSGAMTIAPPPVTPPAPICTEDEEAAAREAYRADLERLTDAVSTTEAAIAEADKIAADANQAYLEYAAYASSRLAAINLAITTTTIVDSPIIIEAKRLLSVAIADLERLRTDRAAAVQIWTDTGFATYDYYRYIENLKVTLRNCEENPDTCADEEIIRMQDEISAYELAWSNLQARLQPIDAAIATARQAVTDAQSDLAIITNTATRTTTPADPALLTEIDNINIELARLQGILDDANRAVQDAVDNANTAEDARRRLPAMTCPYTPAPPPPTPAPPPPPPPPPEGTTCTAAQEEAARIAYDQAVTAAINNLNTAENAISEADVAAAAANQAWLDYNAYATSRLAEIGSEIITASITPSPTIIAAQRDLDAAILNLRNEQLTQDAAMSQWVSYTTANAPTGYGIGSSVVRYTTYIKRTQRGLDFCRANPSDSTCTAENINTWNSEVATFMAGQDAYLLVSTPALRRIAAAQTEVNRLRDELNALVAGRPTIATPPPALADEITRINAELDRLQRLLDDANLAVTNAGTAADDAERARLAVPPYTCPYP